MEKLSEVVVVSLSTWKKRKKKIFNNLSVRKFDRKIGVYKVKKKKKKRIKSSSVRT